MSAVGVRFDTAHHGLVRRPSASGVSTGGVAGDGFNTLNELVAMGVRSPMCYTPGAGALRPQHDDPPPSPAVHDVRFTTFIDRWNRLCTVVKSAQGIALDCD